MAEKQNNKNIAEINSAENETNDKKRANKNSTENKINDKKRTNKKSEKNKSFDIDKLMEKARQQEMAALEATFRQLDSADVMQAVHLLQKAKKIYVIGIRTALPIAQTFVYYLHLIGLDAVLVSTTDMNETFEQLLFLNEKDVVVGIGFSGYSLRTIKALEYANDKNASIISITDGPDSPINLYSSCKLWAHISSVSIVDSYIAPMSLVYLLIETLTMKNQKRVEENIANLSQVWENYQMYGNDNLSGGEN